MIPLSPGSFSLRVHTRSTAHAPTLRNTFYGQVRRSGQAKKKQRKRFSSAPEAQWDRHGTGSTDNDQRQQKTQNVKYGQNGRMAGMCCLLLRQRRGGWTVDTVKMSTFVVQQEAAFVNTFHEKSRCIVHRHTLTRRTYFIRNASSFGGPWKSEDVDRVEL